MLQCRDKCARALQLLVPPAEPRRELRADVHLVDRRVELHPGKTAGEFPRVAGEQFRKFRILKIPDPIRHAEMAEISYGNDVAPAQVAKGFVRKHPVETLLSKKNPVQRDGEPRGARRQYGRRGHRCRDRHTRQSATDDWRGWDRRQRPCSGGCRTADSGPRLPYVPGRRTRRRVRRVGHLDRSAASGLERQRPGDQRHPARAAGRRSLPIAPTDIPARAAVLDLTYRPRATTAWIAACDAAGHASADGRVVLLAQGVASWTHWFTGVAPPIDVMRAALDGRLG